MIDYLDAGMQGMKFFACLMSNDKLVQQLICLMNKDTKWDAVPNQNWSSGLLLWQAVESVGFQNMQKRSRECLTTKDFKERGTCSDVIHIHTCSKMQLIQNWQSSFPDKEPSYTFESNRFKIW